MSRRKLTRIKMYDISRARLAAVKSIDPKLDLGNNITVTNYEKAIIDFGDLLGKYNTALSTVDDLYNQCIDGLDNIRDMNERVLTGVATRYGKKSSEYEMAGGTRKTERKKSTPKPAK